MKRTIRASICAVLVLLLMAAMCAVVPFTAGAAATSFETAEAYTMGTDVSETLSKGMQHFYKFTLADSGKVSVNLNIFVSNAYVTVYDGAYKEIDKDTIYDADKTHPKTLDRDYYLKSGDYYFEVSLSEYSDKTGDYNFKLEFEGWSDTQQENLNSINDGTTITPRTNSSPAALKSISVH